MSIRTYEQGFRDGMKMKNGVDSTFSFMGYTMEKLLKIITEYEERQPTKVEFDTNKFQNGLIIEVDGKQVYQK